MIMHLDTKATVYIPFFDKHDKDWYESMEKKFKERAEIREKQRAEEEKYFCDHLELEQIRDMLDCQIYNGNRETTEKVVKEFFKWYTKTTKKKIDIYKWKSWLKSGHKGYKDAIWIMVKDIISKADRCEVARRDALNFREYLDKVLEYDDEFYEEGYAWSTEEKCWI